jgi:hypothetical protein
MRYALWNGRKYPRRARHDLRRVQYPWCVRRCPWSNAAANTLRCLRQADHLHHWIWLNRILRCAHLAHMNCCPGLASCSTAFTRWRVSHPVSPLVRFDVPLFPATQVVVGTADGSSPPGFFASHGRMPSQSARCSRRRLRQPGSPPRIRTRCGKRLLKWGRRVAGPSSK